MVDVERAVYEYMKSQNRPYSALDVFNNLHKKFGKTAVVKALESLAEKKKMLEKTYGKSKIYVIEQSQFSAVDDVKLKELDDKISMLHNSVNNLRSNWNESNSQLKSLTSSLTTENALVLRKTLQEETGDLEKKLNRITSNSVCVDAVQKELANKNHKSMISQWRKRKRMTVDLINAVLEGYPKTKKQFFEEVGIETDEDCKVSIPDS